MSPLRLASLAALVLGVLLLLAAFAVPTCRNFAGTARDSGYPCKVQHSSGSTEFIFSRTSSVSVPRAEVVAIVVLGLGVIGLRRSRPA